MHLLSARVLIFTRLVSIVANGQLSRTQGHEQHCVACLITFFEGLVMSLLFASVVK